MLPEIPHFPESLPRTTEYTVLIDDRPVPVLETRVGAVALFQFAGTVDVVIRTSKPFENVDVRPLSRDIPTERHGTEVRLRLESPGNFSVEFDGDARTPLFLFAGPLRAERPDPADPMVRVLQAGEVHRFDELHLESGQTLYFEPGAVLEAPLRATDATNIRVLGMGIIDSRYRSDLKTDAILFRGCRDIFMQDVYILDSFGWTLHLFDCEDVILENIRQTCWRANCDGVDINTSRRVEIRDSFLYNTDDCVAVKVLDPDVVAGRVVGVEDVLVVRTVMWNGAGGNAMEIGFELNGAEVRNVTFLDCDIIRVEKGACLSIHVGDTSLVHDIRFEDIRIEDARDELIDFTIGLSIYSHDCPEPFHRRNGFNVPPELQDLKTGDNWLQWLLLPEPDYSRHADGRGRIEDILIRDIRILGEHVPPSVFIGYNSEKAVRRVRIENLNVGGKAVQSLPEDRIYRRNASEIDLTPGAEVPLSTTR